MSTPGKAIILPLWMCKFPLKITANAPGKVAENGSSPQQKWSDHRSPSLRRRWKLIRWCKDNRWSTAGSRVWVGSANWWAIKTAETPGNIPIPGQILYAVIHKPSCFLVSSAHWGFPCCVLWPQGGNARHHWIRQWNRQVRNITAHQVNETQNKAIKEAREISVDQ